MAYVRFQSPERDERLGINIGVFGLLNMLDSRGMLNPADTQARRQRLDWFRRRVLRPGRR